MTVKKETLFNPEDDYVKHTKPISGVMYAQGGFGFSRDKKYVCKVNSAGVKITKSRKKDQIPNPL